MTVLGPPRLNGHELPVVSFDRKRHSQYRIARLNYADGASYDRQLLIRRQLTAKRVCQTIFYKASGLVKEFIYRVCKSILAGSRDICGQATSDASQHASRS